MTLTVPAGCIKRISTHQPMNRKARPKKALRCPRCGNAALRIVEKSNAFTTFFQDAAGRIDPEDTHNTHGLITGLIARCDPGCAHSWRVRGAKQIIELAGYPQERGTKA